MRLPRHICALPVDAGTAGVDAKCAQFPSANIHAKLLCEIPRVESSAVPQDHFPVTLGSGQC